jgi:putative phage-type endonuclease
MQQHSDEWFKARLGKITASQMANIQKSRKAGRANYMADKIVELLTDSKIEGFTSPAMEWGTEQEANARIAYQAKTGAWVEEVGFMVHPDNDRMGASPDGLVDDDGCMEIKCPNTATHIDTILNEKIKLDYVWQMNTVMAVFDKKWCDFVSFDPRLPEPHNLYIKRFFRDELLIADIMKLAKEFLIDLDVKIAELEAKGEKA